MLFLVLVHNKSGGDEKRQNPKANANAMYCNRRTRDKDRLKEWIHDIKLELDPRMRIAKIQMHRSAIEAKWNTHYISDTPRLKNAAPSIAWREEWSSMDQVILGALLEIKRMEMTTDNVLERHTVYDLAAKDKHNNISQQNAANEQVKQEDDGGKRLLEGRHKQAIKQAMAIHTDELNEAHIAVLQEKLSACQKKLESFENQALSDKYRYEIYYMETILNLNQSNDFHTTKNKKLSHELNEARTREAGLQELLSASQKEVTLLTDELNDAHILVLQEKISSSQKTFESFENQLIDEQHNSRVYKDLIAKISKSNDSLTAENKKLNEESARRQRRRLIKRRRTTSILSYNPQSIATEDLRRLHPYSKK